MKKSGIYEIKSIINSKIYIGSTINLSKRKGQHFSDLKFNKHSNIHLQKAYNKYGKDNFTFNIIKYCIPGLLLKKEQYYLDTLKPEYNIRIIAENNLGVKASKESRRRMSEAHKGKPLSPEHIEKGRQSRLGTKRSEETKKKMRQARLGMKFSIEHITNAIKARQIPIIQLTKDEKFVQGFDSIELAGKSLKIAASHIGQCCKYEAGLESKYKTCGGFRWIYKKDYK